MGKGTTADETTPRAHGTLRPIRLARHAGLLTLSGFILLMKLLPQREKETVADTLDPEV